jgi:DNA-binding GntR family transcriptional regulator
MIIDGELSPGEKLLQDDLANRLGVSRTPFLYAFSKLEQENLVAALPRRGAYVKKHSAKELRDIFDIRARLEPLGTKEATLRAAPDDIARLEVLLKAFDAAFSSNNDKELKKTDYDFHMEILRISGNVFLFDMLATCNSISIGNIHGPKMTLETADCGHHALLAAIKAKDAQKAEEIMFRHIDGPRREHISRFSAL